jgi:uncharacterized membrane protein YphA (DoxX/SURF4 family)
MKPKTIGYWIATALLALSLVVGATGDLTRAWGTLETVTNLGYPAYLLTILGMWKVLGAITLLIPRFPRLKEWMYAGVVFTMTGAALSHALSNDFGSYGLHVITPLILAGIAIASWALRPQDRTLGTVFPTRSVLTSTVGYQSA